MYELGTMMTFSDDDLKFLKEDLADLSDDSGVPAHVGLFKALLARLEAAEACLQDVWNIAIDDVKLEAWRKSCGK